MEVLIDITQTQEVHAMKTLSFFLGAVLAACYIWRVILPAPLLGFDILTQEYIWPRLVVLGVLVVGGGVILFTESVRLMTPYLLAWAIVGLYYGVSVGGSSLLIYLWLAQSGKDDAYF